MSDATVIATCADCRGPVLSGTAYSMRSESSLVYGRIGDPSPFPTGRTKPVRIYLCASCALKDLIA